GRHRGFSRDWSSDVCSSDLTQVLRDDRKRAQSLLYRIEKLMPGTLHPDSIHRIRSAGRHLPSRLETAEMIHPDRIGHPHRLPEPDRKSVVKGTWIGTGWRSG